MTNETVKLGLMPPLTGLVGLYGAEITHAAQVACQEINDNGGVLGKPLELIIEDDGSLPDSAVIAAKRLVEDHQCSAIIGNLLSNSRIAVAYQVAEPAKVPLLNFSFYEGSILSRYFFHFAALPNQQIYRMIPYMCEKFGPKIFFAGNNYEWPRGSIDAGKLALKELSGEVVGEEYLPIGVTEKDIDELLDQVEAAAPDVFVPYFAGADQVLLLTRFTERGLKEKMAVVMGHYDEMMASTLPANVREGFYSSNTYFMTIDSDSNRDYLSRLAKLPDVDGIWPEGNGILTNFGEGTYLCVKAFAQAANEAGSLDSEKLIQVLKNISVTSPQGEVDMNPEYHHAKVNTYLSHCNADGVFNIVEKFGAIEPRLPDRYSHQRISHQATMEEDIRLQARMLEQLTEAVILISSDSGSVLYVNAGAEQIFGYDKGNMIGLNISQLNYSDDGSHTNQLNEIINTLNTKGSWEGETQNIKNDASLIWTRSTISTFTHPVHGEVWLSVYRDISEAKITELALKESEEKFRLINSQVPGIVYQYMIDKNGVHSLPYASPRVEEYIGISDTEVMDDVNKWFSKTHPDDYDGLVESIIHSQQHMTVWNWEGRFIKSKNDIRWLHGTSAPTKLSDGSILWNGVFIDVTDRKQAEEELDNYRHHLEDLVKERTKDLEEARDIAEQASSAKNEFLSRMSHELRTPMNAILGFAQVLDMDDLEKRQHSHINEILTGGAHLLELINELLDLSRIEAGKIEIVMESVKVLPAIEYAIKSIHPLVEKMNLTLDTKCDDEFEVLADTTRFTQVLINLLSNAAKYNSYGGRIGVSCSVVLNNHLRISIRDTGHGLREEQMEGLFEPFNRLGAELSAIEGTGIGLALTKQLVTLMGGEIFVESIENEGSTFSFELSLSKNIKSNESNNVNSLETSNTSKTLLYVEDNSANMRVVEAIIARDDSIDLLTATNGEHGLELAKKCLPDLILLDIHLPKMSGYEIFEELKSDQNTKHIPVIALTADAMPIDIEKGLKAGFIKYVTKPIKIDLLMGAINDVFSENENSVE